jgi:hypothetical protein
MRGPQRRETAQKTTDDDAATCVAGGPRRRWQRRFRCHAEWLECTDYPHAGWLVGVGRGEWPGHEAVMNADARDPQRQKDRPRTRRRQKEGRCCPDWRRKDCALALGGEQQDFYEEHC